MFRSTATPIYDKLKEEMMSDAPDSPVDNPSLEEEDPWADQDNDEADDEEYEDEEDDDDEEDEEEE